MNTALRMPWWCVRAAPPKFASIDAQRWTAARTRSPCCRLSSEVRAFSVQVKEYSINEKQKQHMCLRASVVCAGVRIFAAV